MAAYVALADGRGEVSCRVRLIDADESREPVFEDEVAVTLPDPLAEVELVFHLRDLAFPEPGEYRLQLLQEVSILDFDAACALEFGKLRGELLQQGLKVPVADLMIASVALVHNLTLVTHNTADYQNIPGLRVDDWLAP